MNSTSRPPGGVTINVDLGSLYVYVIGMDNPFLCFEVPIACVLVMDSDGRADEPMLSLAVLVCGFTDCNFKSSCFSLFHEVWQSGSPLRSAVTHAD